MPEAVFQGGSSLLERCADADSFCRDCTLLKTGHPLMYSLLM